MAPKEPRESGLGHEVLKKNRNFYIGVAGTVLEGMLSGSLFMLLYAVMQFLWAGRFDMNRALVLTGLIAGIFLLRILIYSYGYTKAQIGGAEVSKNIRLFMGDHLKRIPLSRFTQGQTGDYINTITSDVNNYEKILTHKIGDLAKSFALSLMLIVFVMTVYVPAGLILLAADLLLIPGLWLSFRMVRKYGREKNDICAENVSSIVEYVSGIQTFRAYGVGGLKNKTVIDAMREFCRISYVYEAKVLPVGAGLSILTLAGLPAGHLDSVRALGGGGAGYRVLSADLHAAPVLRETGQHHLCGPHQLQKPDDLQKQNPGRHGRAGGERQYGAVPDGYPRDRL